MFIILLLFVFNVFVVRVVAVWNKVFNTKMGVFVNLITHVYTENSKIFEFSCFYLVINLQIPIWKLNRNILNAVSITNLNF